jgi:tetratricopeptide (TPR) repeat protein
MSDGVRPMTLDEKIESNSAMVAKSPTYALLCNQGDFLSQKAWELESDGENADSIVVWRDAATFYWRAHQISDKDPLLDNALAVALLNAGDIDGAVEEIEVALSKDSTNAEFLWNAGFIYDSAGRYDEALAAYQASIDSDPSGITIDTGYAGRRVQSIQQTGR